MKILVQVTNEDIRAGITDGFRCDTCPVALALQRAGLDYARAFSTEFYYDRRFFRLPRSARRFINSFDANKEVTPFNFFVKV